MRLDNLNNIPLDEIFANKLAVIYKINLNNE